jgi:hypothetical protein
VAIAEEVASPSTQVKFTVQNEKQQQQQQQQQQQHQPQEPPAQQAEDDRQPPPEPRLPQIVRVSSLEMMKRPQAGKIDLCKIINFLRFMYVFFFGPPQTRA